VRAAAKAAGTAVFSVLNPHSTPLVVPMLFAGMDQKRNWQTKVRPAARSSEGCADLGATGFLPVSAACPPVCPSVHPSSHDPPCKYPKPNQKPMLKDFIAVGSASCFCPASILGEGFASVRPLDP
jgi:hypothetical protein